MFYILAGLGMGVYSLWVPVTAPLGYWLTEAGLLLCGIILALAFSGALFRKLRPPRTPPSTKE